ncbi:MAG: hypothetical protein M1818_005562 [Claussenomyces sp. TS43310]|nr:MAG: hypothetical protein M1818_005562 [Claussenomyces sp. TS43310]
MAAVHRGPEPIGFELPYASTAKDSPPISALFLIYFDIKAGYTISWKRALSGIELEGVVEYKSLPSGLHTVKDDLIYFIHEQYAGLSAFVNAPDAESSRNARMIAVGILVPLSYGRLGRSWKHAEALKAIGQQLVLKPAETEILEKYWEAHKPVATDERPPTASSSDSLSTLQGKPVKRRVGQSRPTRNRSASDGTALLPPGHHLSAYHPAWNLPWLLETFGPLMFPIYRAAMLRKRILISCHAPVHQICDFVYDLSVISNIPLAVSNLLWDSAPPQRIRPFFTVGVHDIPFLEEDLKASELVNRSTTLEDQAANDVDSLGSGWIACTTDGILATKNTLYDVLITLPQASSEDRISNAWPKVQSSDGAELKATQRDLRRYRSLKWGLSRLPQSAEGSLATKSNSQDRPEPYPRPSSLDAGVILNEDVRDTDSIVEPLSWSALAYTGFMWWASAGERHIAMDDEFENDSALLEGLDLNPPDPASGRSRDPPDPLLPTQSLGHTAGYEMAIIAYFHRLSANIMTVISDIVDATDSDDEREDALLRPGTADGGDGPAVFVSSAEVAKMGLDSWSKADQGFIEELIRLYFGRKAHLEGRSVDVCGVKIC